jgi:hypothetical protein
MNKKRYCPDNVECIPGVGCHDLCVELDNLNVVKETKKTKKDKVKENYMERLLRLYGRNKNNV